MNSETLRLRMHPKVDVGFIRSYLSHADALRAEGETEIDTSQRSEPRSLAVVRLRQRYDAFRRAQRQHEAHLAALRWEAERRVRTARALAQFLHEYPHGKCTVLSDGSLLGER